MLRIVGIIVEFHAEETIWMTHAMKNSGETLEWQNILNSMTEDIGHRDKVKEKLKRNLAEHVQLKQALTDSNNQNI